MLSQIHPQTCTLQGSVSPWEAAKELIVGRGFVTHKAVPANSRYWWMPFLILLSQSPKCSHVGVWVPPHPAQKFLLWRVRKQQLYTVRISGKKSMYKTRFGDHWYYLYNWDIFPDIETTDVKNVKQALYNWAFSSALGETTDISKWWYKP